MEALRSLWISAPDAHGIGRLLWHLRPASTHILLVLGSAPSSAEATTATIDMSLDLKHCMRARTFHVTTYRMLTDKETKCGRSVLLTHRIPSFYTLGLHSTVVRIIYMGTCDVHSSCKPLRDSVVVPFHDLSDYIHRSDVWQKNLTKSALE